MNELETLKILMQSLTVFRGVLKDRVIAALVELLEAQTESASMIAQLYGQFVSTLFESGESLTAYINRLVLREDNFYIRQLAAGQKIDEQVERAASRDLEVLCQLSRLSGEDYCRMVEQATRNPAVRVMLKALPLWTAQRDNDLPALYDQNRQLISKKGYGQFACFDAFFVDQNGKLAPIKTPDSIRIQDFKGYERERAQVIENTRALIEGRPAVNLLLYGDRGTGKSSTVKAVANEFKEDGVRIVEVTKDRLCYLRALTDELGANPLKFILFIDDLSFSQNDDNFAALKAVLEGTLSKKPDNVVIYATSNRRHLVKENFKDREGDDIHLADTLEEVLSLSDRFGKTITFLRPNKDAFCKMVVELARDKGSLLPEDQLIRQAEAYAISKGGRSARVAQQFTDMLK